jgi:hypothetical protein
LLDSAERVGCLDILKMAVIAFAALIVIPDHTGARAAIELAISKPSFVMATDSDSLLQRSM